MMSVMGTAGMAGMAGPACAEPTQGAKPTPTAALGNLPRPTRDQAMAMVQAAIAQYRRDGAGLTFSSIMNSRGPYRDRDLFVWVSDLRTGMTLAHGVNPRLLRKDLTQLRDPDGRAFVQTIQTEARKGHAGWVKHLWPNPVNNVLEPVDTYFEPWDDLAFCAGVFKPDLP